MIRKKILILFLLLFSFSYGFNLGDNIGTFSLPNQFDEKVVVDKKDSIIIISFEKGTGTDINEFLSTKKEEFLKAHNAVFIADISGMPSIITKMFALPKMRSYKHNILLIYDEEDNRFKSKEGKSTLYRLKDGVIKSITYIDKTDLPKVFE